MKKIQERDPLKLHHSRGSSRVYGLLVFTLILLGAGLVLFGYNFMSGRGKFDRDYYSNYYTWQSSRLAERMGQIEMSFKIMPIVDNLRNRDQFQMEHRGIVNDEDKRLVQWSDFFNYKQSYFWYNNTVKNFPTFAYDEETPEVQTSEEFCIHIWWNPPKREKAYDLFEQVYGQPHCLNNGASTKFIWKPNDPTTGLSFPLFKRV